MAALKALLLALFVDVSLGDPVYAWHPVRLMGQLIQGLENRLYKTDVKNRQLFQRGMLLTVLAIICVATVYGIITWLCDWLMGTWHWLLIGLLASQLLAIRSLIDEGRRIISVMQTGTLEQAQRDIGYLVSRDTANLKATDIYKAAVETMTENITDAIVAPLFYYALFGVVGMAVYKVINTMDSMIGYKNQRYLWFGKFAARLDDVANFIPARLAAVCILLSALFLKGDSAKGVRCFIEQRKYSSSPNAGCTEAAMAGVLGISLSGPTAYFGKVVERPWIGYQLVDIGEVHLTKTIQYVACSAIFGALLALLITWW